MFITLYSEVCVINLLVLAQDVCTWFLILIVFYSLVSGTKPSLCCPNRKLDFLLFLFSSYFDHILYFDKIDVPMSGDTNSTANILTMLWTGLLLSNSGFKTDSAPVSRGPQHAVWRFAGRKC